jgi:hypothetical protein
MRTFRIAALIIVIVGFAWAPAFAGALIRITPTGVTVSAQGATGLTSPVPIAPDGFRLTYHSQGGADDIVDPLILILATPTGTASSAPPLVWSNGNPYNPVNSNPADGTHVDVSGGSLFPTVYNQTNAGGTGTQNVYNFTGLNYGNASEHWVNWNGASGVPAWNLWTYRISFDPNLGTGDWVEFSTGLAVGSFVVGYGCSGGTVTSTGCQSNGNTQSTPFTFSGMVVASEPASVLLFGTGAAVLLAARRRRNA